jgi:hypothetical protein
MEAKSSPPFIYRPASEPKLTRTGTRVKKKMRAKYTVETTAINRKIKRRQIALQVVGADQDTVILDPNTNKRCKIRKAVSKYLDISMSEKIVSFDGLDFESE